MSETELIQSVNTEITANRDYSVFKQEFDTEIKRASDSFVRIGFLLKEARDTGILEGSGYTSMSDFATNEYGITPDQASRFIGVYERFGDGEGHLKAAYSAHGQTKLIEMLSLPESVAESIPAELPREDIRQIKQEIKEEQQVTPIERAIESSDIPEGLNDLEAFIFVHLKDINIFRKYWNAMQTISAWDKEALLMMFDEAGIKVFTEKLPRRGRILLSFNGTENKPAIVDVRQDSRSEIEWDDLHTALSYRLYPGEVISDTPEEDYEVSYGPVEKPAKLVGESVSEIENNANGIKEEVKEEPKAIENEELAPAQVKESPESQSATNFEHESVEAQQVKEEDPEPSSDEPVEEITEIERAQFMNPPVEDEDTYFSKAKKAAAALDSAVFEFMRDFTDQYPMSSEIQDQMDRIEEKVAEWRNIMIAWRKSMEIQ